MHRVVQVIYDCSIAVLVKSVSKYVCIALLFSFLSSFLSASSPLRFQFCLTGAFSRGEVVMGRVKLGEVS